MTGSLRVGTRASALARAQTELVVRSLRRRHPRLEVEVRPLTTSGDRDRRPGISPDFTDTIDRALMGGEVDLGVHSAKDLPSTLVSGLRLAAVPPRADPRDCLVVRDARDAPVLAQRARVGSSSPRRRAQLLRWRPDLEVVEIRGNVDTRLRRLRDGGLDAIVVARAGLERLGRADAISRVLPRKEFLPAPAQGAIALVTREDDAGTAAIVRAVDHRATHAAVEAERAFSAALAADCRVPLAALATVAGSLLELEGELLAPNGRIRLRGRRSGPSARGRAVGERLARTLLDRGARALLPASPP